MRTQNNILIDGIYHGEVQPFQEPEESVEQESVEQESLEQESRSQPPWQPKRRSTPQQGANAQAYTE